MPCIKLSVREIHQEDIELITNYWVNAKEAYLIGLGVDRHKIPSAEEWRSMLSQELHLPYEEKNSYYIIWLLNEEAVGHSNVDKIIYGQEAFMHLHLWKNDVRKKSVGTELVKMTLPYFFNSMKLKKLYCEPYALNPAPNKTLQKAGFQFIKKHTTIPGWLNFEQEVNLWELTNEKYKEQIKL